MGTPGKNTAKFVETTVDDEVLIVDLDGGELLSLKGTAREIWSLIDGARSSAQVIADLAARYPAAKGAVAEDVEAFLALLEAEGLVTIANRQGLL